MTSRLESLILRRLASEKHYKVGQAIGKDESTISRIASNERGLRIDELEAFFDALGLKVVPADSQMIPSKELEALRYLAQKSLCGVTHE